MERWEREQPLTERERRQLQDDGYLVREGIFTRQECDALNAHMLRKIAQAAEEYVSGERTEFVRFFGNSRRNFEVFWDLSEGTPMKLPASEWHRYVQRIGHGLHLEDPEFLRFVRAPAIACMLEEALAPPVKIVLSVVVYKQPNQKVGYYPWHQDAVYVRTEPSMVNTFVALDDMTEENGCLQVVPGSHRFGFEPHPHMPIHISIDDDSPGYRHRTFRPEETVSLPIEQGSVVILPGTTYHKSEVNRSDKVRRSLLFDCVSATAKVRPDSLINEPPEGWMPMRTGIPV